MCDLPFDVIKCTGKLYQVGVGGRRRAKQDVPHRVRIGSAASSNRAHHRRCRRIHAQAQSGQHSL
jgi:hypothetical protein